MHNALFLLAAIACEVTATTALNYTHQFTRLLPSVITVVGYVASFYLLSMALRTVQPRPMSRPRRRLRL